MENGENLSTSKNEPDYLDLSDEGIFHAQTAPWVIYLSAVLMGLGLLIGKAGIFNAAFAIAAYATFITLAITFPGVVCCVHNGDRPGPWLVRSFMLLLLSVLLLLANAALAKLTGA
jgi:hypothetical protein